MENFVSKVLPVAIALKHITDVLVVGGADRNVLVNCDADIDVVHVIAPESASLDKLVNFAHGGLLPRGPTISNGRTLVQSVPTTVSVAASILSAELRLCSRPQLWIQEALLTLDEVVARGLPHKIVGGALYLIFTSKLDEQRVAELLRYSVLSWHFLAFVTDARDKVDSVDELTCMARFILIGAYDGESFLYTRTRCDES